jgi:transposase-like protein
VPVPHARPITLTTAERRRLTALAYSHTAAYQQVIRARIICDAARGDSNAAIARRHDLTVDTVRRWRGRFADEGLPGLTDRPRPGRPPRLTPVQVAEIKALACQLPAETGAPLSKWSCPDLAAEAVDRRIVAAISASTIRRILARDTIKPWQHQSWIFIRDPQFAVKASRVLGLYARTFDGIPLGEDEYVISSDEKTSIQARCRCHPTLAPGVARTMRVNHEYQRKGALAYLAAYDVHQARIFSHRNPKTGIVPFMNLVEQVMTQEALRHGETGVLGRRQRILTPRPSRGRPPHDTVPERDHGPHPDPRLLAQPDRDLLLDHPAQSPHTQRLHQP